MDALQQSLFCKDDKAKKEIIKKIARMPKADLHRHLTGSIRIGTLAEIINQNNIQLPYIKGKCSFEILKNKVILDKPTSSLKTFISRPWKILNKILINTKVIDRISFEAVEDAALENIDYLEIRISPYGLSNQVRYIPYNAQEFMESIISGIKRAQKKYPRINTRIILCVPRHIIHMMSFVQRQKYFDEFFDLMESFKSFVVGADLTGIEQQGDLMIFKPLFGRIKNGGFGITIHAGETTNSDEIWLALNILGADRIGHGVKGISDHKLIGYLRNKKIPLEICLTSNLLTGAVDKIENHPVYKLSQSNVPITINTDNTLVCDTNINKEFELLINNFDYKETDILTMISNSKKTSFLPHHSSQLIEN